MTSTPPYSPQDAGITIALMGATGTGKSTFINLVSKSSLKVGKSLRSCTSTVDKSDTFVLDGVPVTLIDTPGFDDTTISDTDILKLIASYLTTSYEKGRKLSGIVYLHRISDHRVGGMSRKNFGMFRKLCGDDSLKNVVIVTNMWSNEITEIELDREAQLETDPLLFKPVLEKGAKMLRHYNTEESAQHIIRHLIHNHPEVLQIQREIVDEKKDIVETQACVELDNELEELRRQHEKEMKDLREQMEEALEERDKLRKVELEEMQKEMEEKLARAEDGRARLSDAFALERERLKMEMEEMAQKVEEEAQKASERQRAFDEAEAKHHERIRELQEQLERTQRENAAKVKELEYGGRKEVKSVQLTDTHLKEVEAERERQERAAKRHREVIKCLQANQQAIRAQSPPPSPPLSRTPPPTNAREWRYPGEVHFAPAVDHERQRRIDEIKQKMEQDKEDIQAQIARLEDQRRKEGELIRAQREREEANLQSRAALLQRRMEESARNAAVTAQAIADYNAKQERKFLNRVASVFRKNRPKGSSLQRSDTTSSKSSFGLPPR